MRKDVSMPKIVKFLLSALAVSLLTSFSYGGDAPAVVKAVRGKAQLISPDGKSSKLKVGQTLAAGSTVETDGKASVDLSIGAAGSALRLENNTVLRLLKLEESSSAQPSRVRTVVSLELGTLKGQVSTSTPGSLFIIKTPEIEINVTGEEFTATAWGEIQVVKGSAEITIGKDKINIAEGHQFDAGSREVGPILAQK